MPVQRSVISLTTPAFSSQDGAVAHLAPLVSDNSSSAPSISVVGALNFHSATRPWAADLHLATPAHAPSEGKPSPSSRICCSFAASISALRVMKHSVAVVGLLDGTVSAVALEESNITSSANTSAAVTALATENSHVLATTVTGNAQLFDVSRDFEPVTSERLWGTAPPSVARSTPDGVPAPIVHCSLAQGIATCVDARGLVALYDTRQQTNGGLASYGRAGFIKRARATCAASVGQSVWIGTESGIVDAVDVRAVSSGGSALAALQCGHKHSHRVNALAPFKKTVLSASESGDVIFGDRPMDPLRAVLDSTDAVHASSSPTAARCVAVVHDSAYVGSALGGRIAVVN
ncbi:hypothetical protein PPROV_000799000 [Pycnococcus provasolii]|uniref:Uncharacterized protein n=2 Tax=Pycnococcus provasolii TaxID=41880 RepID=A0A830HRC2_9CHLO|nr:hypothetical protein PPROV_000799000 [Pycnococcus provasolii]